MARPLVAITGPEKGALGPRVLVALAVFVYGGRPLQLKPSHDLSQVNFDAVVVTGGHDIHPVLYAAEPEVEPRYDDQRDRFEMQVIATAIAQERPLLGICRGAQLVNVYRGGSLYQQLHLQRRKTSHRWTLLPLKTLITEPGSWLAQFLERPQARINSLHNQAINQLGKGLKVSGRDLDGIVQAIEDPCCRFLVGVQWHPEFLLPIKKQRQLFKALVEAAKDNQPN